jgi:hypothetical protein
VVFANEPDEIVIVTVLVYYGDRRIDDDYDAEVDVLYVLLLCSGIRTKIV